MKILALTEMQPNAPETVSGCDFYRMVMPMEHMAYSKGIHVDYCNKVSAVPDPTQYDLFLFSRKDIYLDEKNKWHNAGNVLQAKEAGLPIIMDLDDQSWDLGPHHLLNNHYIKNKVKDKTIAWMKLADAITVTTQGLADAVRPYNPNVHIIPNAIHPLYSQYQWSECDRISSDKVRIGWIGGRHHLNDMDTLRFFFKKFWNDQELSDKASVVMGGYNPDDPIIHAMAELMTGITVKGRDNILTIPGMNVFEYANMYKHIDIALAPLAYNQFNKCKSELKLIEAGWFGVPVIATDIYPYNTVIQHGHNGFLVRGIDPGKWFEYASQLINDPKLRYQMGQNLKQTILDRFPISKVNEARYKLYCELSGKA